MPVNINGQDYYRTNEVCRMISVSRNTLFRLANKSIFNEAERRDIRGWRLFTLDEINSLNANMNRINLIRRAETIE